MCSAGSVAESGRSGSASRFWATDVERRQHMEARDSLREARRLNPIGYHDRETLAAAYGRLMWPFRVL